MPLRRDIYKKQDNAGFPVASEDEKHWIRDWYDPPKLNKDLTYLQQNPNMMASMDATPQPVSGTQSTTSQSQTPQPLRTHGFKIKSWIVSDKANDFKDCEDDDKDAVINLDEYTYIKIEGTRQTDNGTGLTEADIKSAVGGTGGGNSLFSSSAAHALKEENEKVNSKVDIEQKVEEFTEVKNITGDTEGKSDIQEVEVIKKTTKDEDGDVHMGN